MLNAMRGFAGSWFARALLILLVLSLGLWGIEDVLRGGSRSAIATVAGHEVSRTEFEQAYRSEMERVRAQLGKNYSPELVKMLRVERRVLDDIITGQLLELETRALGLVISDAEIAREIGGMDAFKDEKGAFSKEKFTAVLRQNNITEQAITQDLRREIATRLMLSSIGAASPANEVMAKGLFKAKQEERSISLVAVKPSLIKDVPNATEEEIQAFYDEHKNTFIQPEYRTLSLITISKDALLKTVEVPEAEVRAEYDSRAALFGSGAAPFEKVRADIERDLRSSRADSAGSTLATKIQDALSGGDSMEEVAKQFGMQFTALGTLSANGTLKAGGKATLPAYDNLLEVAFKLEEGAESALTPAKDVYFMVRAEEVEEAAPLPLEQVKPQVALAWKKERMAEKLSALANQIASEMKEGDVNAALAKHGLKAENAGMISRTTQATTSGVKLPNSLVADVFSTAVGSSTSAYETADDSFLIAHVTSRKVSALSDDAIARNADYTTMKTRLQQNMKNEMVQNFVLSLRDKYNVTVNDEALSAYAERE